MKLTLLAAGRYCWPLPFCGGQPRQSRPPRHCTARKSPTTIEAMTAANRTAATILLMLISIPFGVMSVHLVQVGPPAGIFQSNTCVICDRRSFLQRLLRSYLGPPDISDCARKDVVPLKRLELPTPSLRMTCSQYSLIVGLRQNAP